MATEGKATIISPLDPDYNYNLYHTATYLATVQVGVYSQPSGTSAYVDLAEYDDRRNQLKNTYIYILKVKRKKNYGLFR